jgi:nitroreductase/dihydropteridine reductase
MNFLENMQNRYTTKKYDTTKKIDLDKIEDLKKILLLSPSSINSQPWKFIFVSDVKTKADLAKASFFNEKKILDSQVLVVFKSINNISLFEKQILNELPDGSIKYYNQFIKPQSELEIKFWFEKQVYLALGVFLSACANLGVDATPMEGIEADKYDIILNSEDYHTIVAVTIGLRDSEDQNQPIIKPKLRKNINQVIKSI